MQTEGQPRVDLDVVSGGGLLLDGMAHEGIDGGRSRRPVGSIELALPTAASSRRSTESTTTPLDDRLRESGKN